MSRYLIDTNLLIYTFDNRTTKKDRAREVLKVLSSRQLAAFSTQVLAEFANRPLA